MVIETQGMQVHGMIERPTTANSVGSESPTSPQIPFAGSLHSKHVLRRSTNSTASEAGVRAPGGGTTTSTILGGLSPPRQASPGLGLITDRESYWTITHDSGCVPALHFALRFSGGEKGQAEWWGGRFGAPLDGYERLADDLPKVLFVEGELDRRLAELPALELFASNSQKTSIENQEGISTGPGHADTCSATRKRAAQVRQVIVLQNDVERERAFQAFAFLANGFVFSRASPSHLSNNPIVLPAKISVPLTRLSSTLNRRPITDYACSVLNNWILKDPLGDFSLENIYVPRTFTGLEEERWFFAVHAVIEHNGGQALISMLQAKEEISQFFMTRKLMGMDKDASKRAVALQRLLGHSKTFSVANGSSPGSSASTSPVSEHHSAGIKSSSFEEIALEKAQIIQERLAEVEESLERINETVKRLPENCPADVFFDRIRRWVSSWPDPGVIYETYCECGWDEHRGNLAPQKYSGASGAQSSLLPSIDGFLGIAYGHKQNMDSTPEVARTDLGAFIRQLKSFRMSMPPQHRDLVARFEGQGNVIEFIAALEEYVLKLNSNKLVVGRLRQQLSLLKLQYNTCIEQLTVFRKTHMDFAVKYIKTMASKRADAGQAGVRGTGGSDYARHLGQHITDTKKSLYNVVPVQPGGASGAATSPGLQLQQQQQQSATSGGGGNASPRLALPTRENSSIVVEKMKRLQ